MYNKRMTLYHNKTKYDFNRNQERETTQKIIMNSACL